MGEEAPILKKARVEQLFYWLAAEDPGVCFLIEAIYNSRFAMVGPGEAITSTSTIENLLAATLFLMGYVTTASNAALPLS